MFKMRLPGPYFPEMATMGGVLVARALQNNQLLVLQCLGGFELRELLRAKRRSARLGCFWRVFPRLGERPPLQVPRRKFCGIHRLPSRLAAAFWSSCDFVNALWQHLLDNSCIFRFFFQFKLGTLKNVRSGTRCSHCRSFGSSPQPPQQGVVVYLSAQRRFDNF